MSPGCTPWPRVVVDHVNKTTRTTLFVAAVWLAASFSAPEAARLQQAPAAPTPARPAVAAPARPSVAPQASRPVTAAPRAVLDRYCVTCHNSRLKTGGLALDAVDPAN